MASRHSPVSFAATVAVLVFLVAPLVVMVAFSFHSADSLVPPFQGVSLRWYREIFADPLISSGFTNSLKVAFVTAIGTVTSGTAAAYGVSRSKGALGTLTATFFLVPLAIPGLIVGVALLSSFTARTVPLSTVTIVMAHLVYVGPVYFLLALTVLNRLDPSQLEAAADLGAPPIYRFRRVVLPQVRSVLFAGGVTAFVLSFDEFVITSFVAGNDPTLPMVVLSRLRLTIHPSVNAISSLMLFSYLVLWLAGFAYSVRVRSQRRRKYNSGAL